MSRTLNQLTLAEAATRLARREISSRELTQACLDQITRVDDRIHAFISYDANDALAQADAADHALKSGTPPPERPLLGVPIAIKDVIAVKGQPLICGSKILGKFISPYDATVIQKLRAAGAVIFGRLNMDEFAMGSSTENSAFGVTRNPWDLSRIPGGSSLPMAVSRDTVSSPTLPPWTRSGRSLKQSRTPPFCSKPSAASIMPILPACRSRFPVIHWVSRKKSPASGWACPKNIWSAVWIPK